MPEATRTARAITVFKQKLNAYKAAIDTDITQYSEYLKQTTLQQYGEKGRLDVDVFLSVLARGGKRIRGALVMQGYEMSGGRDQDMIVQAARAIEMLHAYILIIDDIQDRSPLRRGGPAAHVMLEKYHQQNSLKSNGSHFGLSLALNAALAGAHAAQILLANLDISEELRLKALSIMNRTMIVTVHGQTYDIMNEAVSDVDAEDIERVLEWKTANYTVLNPLHVGMVLAGADCKATDAITDYALHLGKAFQIIDDINSTFGAKEESGKDPMDDVREGKQTVLTHYAFNNTLSADKAFLKQTLGKHNVNLSEFQRYKQILKSSGAYDYAYSQAKGYIDSALTALNRHKSLWSQENTAFLQGMSAYLLQRKA